MRRGRGNSGPNYKPDSGIEENYNFLKIAEIHAFEEVNRHDQ